MSYNYLELIGVGWWSLCSYFLLDFITYSLIEVAFVVYIGNLSLSLFCFSFFMNSSFPTKTCTSIDFKMFSRHCSNSSEALLIADWSLSVESVGIVSVRTVDTHLAMVSVHSLIILVSVSSSFCESVSSLFVGVDWLSFNVSASMYVVDSDGLKIFSEVTGCPCLGRNGQFGAAVRCPFF